MNTKKLIKQHDLAIKILEGIQVFEMRIAIKIDTIKYLGEDFPSFTRDSVQDIDTLKRSIKRLEERYNKL